MEDLKRREIDTPDSRVRWKDTIARIGRKDMPSYVVVVASCSNGTGCLDSDEQQL